MTDEKRCDWPIRDKDIETWRLCIEYKHEPQPRLGEFNWPWVLGRALDEIERLQAALGREAQLRAAVETLCVEFADEAIDAEPAWHAEPSIEFARSAALRWAAGQLRALLSPSLDGEAS